MENCIQQCIEQGVSGVWESVLKQMLEVDWKKRASIWVVHSSISQLFDNVHFQPTMCMCTDSGPELEYDKEGNDEPMGNDKFEDVLQGWEEAPIWDFSLEQCRQFLSTLEQLTSEVKKRLVDSPKAD